MRKASFLLMVLALSASTMAATPRAAPAKDLPHFDFKGLTANTTLEEATPKLKQVDAYMGTNKGGHLIDDNISGKPANVRAVFDDQGLLVMHGDPLDYEETKEAFSIKWGRPVQTINTPLQNGFGARINSETAIWRFSEGVLTLHEGGFRGNPSFSWESHRHMRRIQESEKVKIDF